MVLGDGSGDGIVTGIAISLSTIQEILESSNASASSLHIVFAMLSTDRLFSVRDAFAFLLVIQYYI